MDPIAQWWERIVSGFTQASAPQVTPTELLLIASAAAVLAVPQSTWRYFGLFTTVVHELGHAFAALMTGRRITGIRLNIDHSGTTTSFGRRGWGTVWSAFWGYPVPAVVGAALVWAGLAGWGPAALSLGVLILLASILFIRNGSGLLILAGASAVSTGLVLAVPAAITGHVVVALGLALLVGAVRDLGKVTAVHLRRRQALASSDAYLLFRATRIPPPVWLLLFAVVIAACLAWAWNSVSSRFIL